MKLKKRVVATAITKVGPARQRFDGTTSVADGQMVTVWVTVWLADGAQKGLRSSDSVVEHPAQALE